MKSISKLFIIIFTVSLFHNFTFSQWVQTTSGTTNFLTSITTISTTINYAAGFSGTFLRSTNSGQTWTTQTSPSASNINAISFPPVGNGTTGWVATVTGIHKTTNSGANWVLQQATAPMTDILFPTLTTGFALRTNNSIHKTTNGGTNFTAVNFTPNSLVGGNKIIQITGDNYLILGVDNTNDTSFIYKTTNQGANWTQHSRITGVFFAISFMNSNTGIICGDQGLAMRTTNGGTNWTSVTTGTTNDLVAIQSVTTNVFCMVGSSGTIKKSTNAGLNWLTQTCPVTANLRSIDMFSSDDFGLIAAAGGIILRTTNGGTFTAVMQNGSEVPESYSLGQNYPNPFNPNTKINFSIPSSGLHNGSNVRLAVYDILGKEVALLVNENLSAGNYSVDFNASSLPTGTYFYRLEAGEFTDTKKLVLIK
jgi:photosystem II stability/assembly factor-like uncharacterized protein